MPKTFFSLIVRSDHFGIYLSYPLAVIVIFAACKILSWLFEKVIRCLHAAYVGTEVC